MPVVRASRRRSERGRTRDRRGITLWLAVVLAGFALLALSNLALLSQGETRQTARVEMNFRLESAARSAVREAAAEVQGTPWESRSFRETAYALPERRLGEITTMGLIETSPASSEEEHLADIWIRARAPAHGRTYFYRFAVRESLLDGMNRLIPVFQMGLPEDRTQGGLDTSPARATVARVLAEREARRAERDRVRVKLESAAGLHATLAALDLSTSPGVPGGGLLTTLPTLDGSPGLVSPDGESGGSGTPGPALKVSQIFEGAGGIQIATRPPDTPSVIPGKKPADVVKTPEHARMVSFELGTKGFFGSLSDEEFELYEYATDLYFKNNPVEAWIWGWARRHIETRHAEKGKKEGKDKGKGDKSDKGDKGETGDKGDAPGRGGKM